MNNIHGTPTSGHGGSDRRENSVKYMVGSEIVEALKLWLLPAAVALVGLSVLTAAAVLVGITLWLTTR